MELEGQRLRSAPVASLIVRAWLLTLTVGLLAFVTPALGASTTNCGSVSYTVPHTGGHGHAALNNLTASNATCTTARSVAAAFLRTRKAPSGWHVSSTTVVVHSYGRANTVSEEIFTRGTARVVGDVAN